MGTPFFFFFFKYCSADNLELRSKQEEEIKRVQEDISARRSSLKGWEGAIVKQMNTGTVSKATLGKLLTDWVVCINYGFSWVHKYHLELNWTDAWLFLAITHTYSSRPHRSLWGQCVWLSWWPRKPSARSVYPPLLAGSPHSHLSADWTGMG